MPKISTQEFERLPLRVHEFLAGVPLHDVWAMICRGYVLVSRWMSFCGRQTPVLAHHRLENEQLLELVNRTAHAAALSALVENARLVPLLLRRLRAQRQSLHADLPGLIDVNTSVL